MTGRTTALLALVAGKVTSTEAYEVSDVGAGNGAAMPAGIVGVSPAPFSFMAQQIRLGDGTLYTLLTFYTATGAFAVFMDGDAGAAFLDGLKPVVNATRANIELAKWNGNA